ncbi:MAG: leucine-rich repeat domain-containing protein, partial [Clostridia bacterium]|nr:leucine-rich repeat domain-containing protein [Clostridia bacterium]
MKKFLSILLTLFIIFCALPFTASADTTSGTTGNCIWILDGTVLTISGNGAMEDYSDISPAPWGTSITEVVIEDGVTNIGNLAFPECINLTSVSIPNSVTKIGDFSFRDCTGLVSVTIANSYATLGVGAFSYCTKLESIVIPREVTIIPMICFMECTNLTSVSISRTITKIGIDAFYACNNITDVYYEGDESDWNNIDIWDDNGPLVSSNIHYNH